MPGPSRRGLIATIQTHLDDEEPHLVSDLVRSPSGGFRWWRQDTFPEIDDEDPLLAHEGDRLTLESAE